MTPHIYHAHPNPKRGRNEPLLVEVEGWDCPECREVPVAPEMQSIKPKKQDKS